MKTGPGQPRLVYDEVADAAYISLVSRGEHRVAATRPADVPHFCRGSINLDFDAGGRLVGIEVLGAKTVLPPAALQDRDSNVPA